MTLASGIAFAIGYSSYLPTGITPDSIERAVTGGAAAGDYDQDGDIDLFITRGDIGANLLYQNNGSGVFTDVAAFARLAYTATVNENYRHSGPAFADMDGDDDLDLFIGGIFGDPSFLFRNNGDGTFDDVTPGSGIDLLQAEFNVAAAFGDYDLDGDLDMFISHWGTDRDPVNPGDTEHLWRNDSSDSTIHFTSVSVEAGISPSIITLADPFTKILANDYTFTPTFARINDDMYPDILSVADYNLTQYFINNGDGTFSNATNPQIISDNNGMGSAIGDYDNDGDLDWFVTAIDDNRLYRNENGSFTDQTDRLGLGTGGWGWGACMFDLENDGDLDIYHTNGWNDAPFNVDRSRAYEAGVDGTFTDRAAAWGLNDTAQGRGVVCADFDNDGDIDILQLHRSLPISATLWRNEVASHNWLRVQLKGRKPNTEAAGARLFLTTGSTTQMREITIGNNFVSQNPALQVFGLGNATRADELRVQWPDGMETITSNVAAGQTLTISHPDR